jgi:hypothetical protein
MVQFLLMMWKMDRLTEVQIDQVVAKGRITEEEGEQIKATGRINEEK